MSTDRFVLKVAGTGGQSQQSAHNWVPLAAAARDLARRGYSSTITRQGDHINGVDIRSVERAPVATSFGTTSSWPAQVLEHINSKEHA